MDFRTFQAASMTEALARIKTDLGREAVILSTRTLGPSLVEITATLDERMTARKPDAASIPHSAFRIPNFPGEFGRRERPSSPDPSSDYRMGHPQARPLGPAPVPAELVEHYTRLISNHVAEDIVRELLASLSASVPPCLHASEVDAELLRLISAMIPPTAPIRLVPEDRPTIVAVVGPTGVGKTTTLAKLAANLKLHAGRSVGLVTLDTFRVGAADQLRLYAELLSVPFCPVTSQSEMQAALQGLHPNDVILIDTPGRGPRDQARIADLAVDLSSAKPDEVHLVLSAAAHPESIREAQERFAMLRPTHVVFTKLDEAIGVGVLLSAVRGMKLRLSYLTHGQGMPGDIQPGSAEKVARMILG